MTYLLLIYVIDSALNTIWCSSYKRPKVYSFAVCWMILTPAPRFVGASLAISSCLLSLRWVMGFNSVIDDVLRLFPLVLCWISFGLLPYLPGRDALFRALVAALLFELGKKAQPSFITMFPSCQPIYGVLAVIHLMFLWVYWTWCIVLPGAEITVTLGEYRKLKQAAKKAEE